MNIFYNPNISENKFELNKNESSHCVKVLRLKINDKINIIDGKGTLFEAKIITPNPKKCFVEITNKIENYGKKKYNLHIAIAPTKNNSRFEWFVEKATEIGIDEISPIVTFHSERKIIKTERFEKIIISAMKQSVKAYKPKLNEIISFSQFVKTDFEGDKYIAYCKTDKKNNLKNLYEKGKNILILIGPEGGFSEQEIKLAEEHDFTAISLSNSKLRTETAGVIACASVEFLNLSAF